MTRARGIFFAVALVSSLAVPAFGQTIPAEQTEKEPKRADVFERTPPFSEQLRDLNHALSRLPIAAGLACVLAFRPRRKGTPQRQAPVIQTQIILAVVGAVVMLVVGSSLARAFGIVGAAGLVRYRAKIADPKDAGVMLSTLALGLASGVGLYAIAIFSAAFILVALWIIESFEPKKRDAFSVKVKIGDDTDSRRRDVEAILRRFRIDFELSSSSDAEICYDVEVPLELRRDRVTNAILKLDPAGHAAVEWAEKKAK
jgi:uncharacterized membrane protein YhiD involved in acid resistance